MSNSVTPVGVGIPEGGRSREPIDAELNPVHGATTIISLPHACLNAGLLEDVRNGQAVNWYVLRDLAVEKWKQSTERFFSDAASVGLSPDSVSSLVADWRGAVIGWESSPHQSRRYDAPFQICHDLGMSVAVLSRCVGDMFVAAREPDYSWEKLFGAPFEFDEHLVPTADLKSDPWSQYQWKLGGQL